MYENKANFASFFGDPPCSALTLKMTNFKRIQKFFKKVAKFSLLCEFNLVKCR